MIQFIGRPAFDGRLGTERYRGLLLRKNLTDLKDFLSRAGFVYKKVGGKRLGNNFVFPAGGTIVCDHMASKDAYQKYQGQEFQRIGGEELTQIPAEELWLRILGSCRSTVSGLVPKVMTNFNPGGPGHHWVRARYVDPSQSGKVFFDKDTGRSRVFIPSRLEDNLILMKKDPDYERFLNGLPEKLRKAWRWGNWDCLEGMFFPEFDKKIHVCKPFDIPRHWPRYLSLDWGYWPDPYVVLFWASDENGRQYLYREVWGNRLNPDQLAKRILKHCERDGVEFDVCRSDPQIFQHQTGVSNAEKMIMTGLVVTAADNTRVQGWSRVHEYLTVQADGVPALQIFETCVKCIETLPQMIHDDHDPLDCLKNSQIDHWPDTIRYHLMSRPGIAPIAEDIKPWNCREMLKRRKMLTSEGIIYDR